MIVLDTNVISELWKAAPEPKVLMWMDAQLVETLYLSAITVAELRFGLAVMPEGQRRHILQSRLERDVLSLFAQRILPFDLATSQVYAERMAKARANGLSLGAADGYIAASAASHGFAVATRDTRPFLDMGVKVINPWE